MNRTKTQKQSSIPVWLALFP